MNTHVLTPEHTPARTHVYVYVYAMSMRILVRVLASMACKAYSHTPVRINTHVSIGDVRVRRRLHLRCTVPALAHPVPRQKAPFQKRMLT